MNLFSFKNFHFALVGVLFSPIMGYSQNCTDESVTSLPGKWYSTSNNNLKGISPVKIKEKMLMDETIELVRKNFPWKPIGGDIRIGSFLVDNDNRPFSISKTCDKYYSSIAYNHFFCSAGKVNHEETSDYIITTFNDLPFEFDQSFYVPQRKLNEGDMDNRTMDGYAIMAWLPAMKNGYLEYIKNSQDSTDEVSGSIYRYRILTKPGILPYLIMDKKEYYEKWRKKHLIEIENSKWDKERISKELAEKPYLKALIDDADKYISTLQAAVDKIDNIFKTKSAEDLARPAYLFEEYGDYFEGRQASNYLRSFIIKPNPTYYNKQLPKNSPQVITILLKYGMGIDENGVKHYSDENFYNALDKMKILDFLSEKLQPLIGH